MINNWLMLCVPRTASTSLSKMLGLRADGGAGEHAENRYFGHMPAAMLRPRFGAKWDEMFTFGFARNPWDRLVSIAARINPRVLASKDTFYAWMTTGCQGQDGGTSFATGGTPITRPCSEFLLPCKYVGKYETLAYDTTVICRVLGLEKVPEWRHDEQCEHKPYTEYYDARSREWVNWYYHTDIVNFGYRFGG